MGKLFDFFLKGFDLQIKNGDFVVDECTNQNVQILIMAEKGEFKQSPTVGVGIVNYIEEDKSGDELAAEIQSEVENDGATIVKMDTKDLTDMTIIAEYGAEDNNS